MAEQDLCPSVTGDSGSEPHIIGFIGANGRVANLLAPIPLTDEVRAAAGPQPERAFRLAGPCVAGGCTHWKNEACSLIGRMRHELRHKHADEPPATKLPRCAIRAACRWWRQDGPEACRVCPDVIYNPSA
jgi:hypothetical protein